MILAQRATEKRSLPVLRGLLIVAAVALFLASSRLTWWSLTMFAPQYPMGLEVSSTLTALSGDVEELDALNHYIGMMPLNNAAQLERKLVPFVLPLFGVMALLTLLTRKKWLAWGLALPLATFPFIFMADLKAWLWYAGNNLDPTAALSSTISGFTPTMLGEGMIAQFRTIGVLGPGFYVALAGALLAAVATWLGTRSPKKEAA